MRNVDELEKLTEQLFEQRQENQRLRGQITYLQEELASTEDDLLAYVDGFSDNVRDVFTRFGFEEQVQRLEAKVQELERQLGDALFARKG